MSSWVLFSCLELEPLPVRVRRRKSGSECEGACRLSGLRAMVAISMPDSVAISVQAPFLVKAQAALP